MEDKQGKSNFPTKKDMAYWILILILFIIGSFTFYYGSKKDVISHIGFAGTIVSILLAVIAIIYSFYQSSTYENVNYKLDNSAQKIKNATDKLSNVSEIKSMLDTFQSEVGFMKDSIEDLRNIVNTIDSGVSSINQKWGEAEKGIFNSLRPTSNNNENIKSDPGFSLDYFIKFLNKGGILPRFLIATIDYSLKHELTVVDLKELNKHYLEFFFENLNPDETLMLRIENVQLGLITSYKQAGIIEANIVTTNKFELSSINKYLSDALQNKLEVEKEQDITTYSKFVKLEKKIIEMASSI
ncbi:hypothetical protein [Heyndrickxia oleronia]|uniref:Uncharacterized protein n=1 Tax=Heyndrickxia oleronia TaxID=38875 RepID=A0AAW6SYR6_9BACI|nr:hypothetical protein [Heyndrickxia oleronia]MDH5163931.1 hypothetical protein [Heyndrickxia oleronia]